MPGELLGHFSTHARSLARSHARTHAPTHTMVAAARSEPHPLLGNRGEDEEASVFATSNEWLRNKTKLNRVFTEEYGPEFPLVKPANLTDALYIAQGELQWLWVGQSAVLCTTGPCILLQVCALPRPNASALVRPRIERFALRRSLSAYSFSLGSERTGPTSSTPCTCSSSCLRTWRFSCG